MTLQSEEETDPTITGDPSLFRLFRKLVNDAAELVRQELRLARIEIAENLRSLARNAGLTAAGAAIAGIGVLVFIEFLVLGLGALLGGVYWLSSLIVAVLLLAIGGGLAYSGVQRLSSESVSPGTALESMGETRRWVGDEINDLRTALTSASGRPAIGRRPPASASYQPLVAESTSGASAIGDLGASPQESLLRRVFQKARRDDVPGRAAAVAFFMFLSLPPGLVVLFAISGGIGGEELATALTGRLEVVLPGSADDPESAAGFFSDVVTNVMTRSPAGPLSFAVLLGLWAASAVFVALAIALNIAYGIEESRPWLKRRFLAIVVMAAFVLLFLSGSGVLLAGPELARSIDLAGAAEKVWLVIQWPIAYLLVAAAFFLVYYTLPNRDQRPVRRVLVRSSLAAAGFWALMTFAFRLYIIRFANFADTYGFVGAILVLLLWMYLTAITILLGGELATEMERTS